MRPILVLLAALLAVAATACGGTSSDLDRHERAVVATFDGDIASEVLDGSAEDLNGSIDRMISLVREKPDAEYDGRTLRQVLDDAASHIELYRPDVAEMLDSVGETLD